MINCPETGRPVHTGMNMSEDAYQSATLENNTITCPHPDCPEDSHTWDEADAYLKDDGDKI